MPCNGHTLQSNKTDAGTRSGPSTDTITALKYLMNKDIIRWLNWELAVVLIWSSLIPFFSGREGRSHDVGGICDSGKQQPCVYCIYMLPTNQPCVLHNCIRKCPYVSQRIRGVSRSTVQNMWERKKLVLALQNHAHLRVTKNILLKSQNQFKGIAEALDHLRLNCTPLVVTDMTNMLYYCNYARAKSILSAFGVPQHAGAIGLLSTKLRRRDLNSSDNLRLASKLFLALSVFFGFTHHRSGNFI